MAISPVKAVEPDEPVLLKDKRPPEDNPVAVEEMTEAVLVVRESELRVKRSFVESQPKPEDSELIAVPEVQKAI